MSNNQLNHQFNVRKKIQAHSTHWPYTRPVEAHLSKSNITLETNLSTTVEYAIYKRDGSRFVLVDFFKNYSEACEEAKAIIDSRPELCRQFKT